MPLVVGTEAKLIRKAGRAFPLFINTVIYFVRFNLLNMAYVT